MTKIISSIDIGTSKVVCLMATITNDNKIYIKSASIYESSGIRDGNIIDIDSAIEAIFKTRIKAEKLINKEITTLAVNVSGSSVKSKHLRHKVETLNNKVSKRDILAIAKSLEESFAKNKKMPIHLMANKSYVDNIEVKSPIGIRGNLLEIDFYTMFTDVNNFNNIGLCFKRNNLKVSNYVFSGFASALAILTENEKQSGTLVLDIGAGLTSFCIMKNNKLLCGHSIPIAGNAITRDISEILKTNLSIAEKIKITNTNFYLSKEEEDDIIKIDIDSDDSFLVAKNKVRIINDIAKARIEEIVNIVIDFLNKKKLLNSFNGIVITGGTANIFGIDNFVSDITKIRTRVGFNNEVYLSPNIDESEIINPSYSTAIGLLYFLNSFYKNNKIEDYKNNNGFFNKIINFLINLFIA